MFPVRVVLIFVIAHLVNNIHKKVKKTSFVYLSWITSLRATLIVSEVIG